jgi:hypothetical protein
VKIQASRAGKTKETDIGTEMRSKALRSHIAKQAKQKSHLASAISKLAKLDDRMAIMGQELEDAQDLLSKSKLSKVQNS